MAAFIDDKVIAKSDDVIINTDLVSTVFEALELIKDLPDVPKYVQKMNEFSREEAQHLASSDLIKIMSGSGPVDLAHSAKVLSQFMSGDKNILSEQAVQDHLDNFLWRCVQQLFSKARLFSTTDLTTQ